MSAPGIEPVSWDEFYKVGHVAGFAHLNRLRSDVDGIKPYCKDLSPFVYEDPSLGALLVMKGKMTEAQGERPAVFFVITVTNKYPNSFPIFSIEQPDKPGWRLANTPHVDREGMCFLNAVSQWNPRSSTLFAACAELQQAVSQDFPFEKGQAPPPAQPAQKAPPPPGPTPAPRPQPQPQVQQPRGPSAPQPQQRAPMPQQQQQPQRQQPQPYHQQPAAAQRPPPQQQQEHHHPNRQNKDFFNEMGTGASLATAGIMRALIGGPTTQQQQQNRGTGGSRWAETAGSRHQRQQADEQKKVAEYAEQQFRMMIQGSNVLPPGAEIILPINMGFQRYRLGVSPIDACKITRNAPPPQAPIAHPTPEMQYSLAAQSRSEERKETSNREAAKPASGFFGKAGKALGAGARALTNVADGARTMVEDKVRDNYASKSQTRFQERFPQESQGVTVVDDFVCRVLGGDGQGYNGHLYITDKAIFFSGKDPAGKKPPQQNVNNQPMAAQQFMVPLSNVVSLVRGHLGALDSHSAQDDFLHVISYDNSVRSFFGWDTSLTSYVSGAPSATPCYKATNWIDHKWRACTAVPNPQYPYDAQQPYLAVPMTVGGPDLKAIAHADPARAMAVPAQPSPAPTPTTQAPTPAPAPTAPIVTAPGAPPASDTTCAVCMDNPKNAFFRPCGHVCVCMSCAKQVKQCPICRTNIQECFQAFL